MYVSKVKSKGHPAVYRFSLNASLPAPWQIVSPGDGEVPSFQVSLGCSDMDCQYGGGGPQNHAGGPWPHREGEAWSVRQTRTLSQPGLWYLQSSDGTGFQVRQTWVRVLALPFIICVSWARLLNLSEPQSPHL